VLFLILSGRAL